jgi:hypothetical protein
VAFVSSNMHALKQMTNDLKSVHLNNWSSVMNLPMQTWLPCSSILPNEEADIDFISRKTSTIWLIVRLQD